MLSFFPSCIQIIHLTIPNAKSVLDDELVAAAAETKILHCEMPVVAEDVQGRSLSPARCAVLILVMEG